MNEGRRDGDVSALRARRKAKQVSLRRLASLLGIGAPRLSEYEHGRYAMPAELLRRAHEVLDDLASPTPQKARKKRPVPTPGSVHPLTANRKERGWTVEDLARQVAKLTRTAPNGSKIWRWEQWGVVPERASQVALAQLFGVSESTALAGTWPAWLPDTEGVDVDSPWTLPGTIAALDAVGEATLDRRGFLNLSSGAVASLADRWTTDSSALTTSRCLDGTSEDVVRTFENRLPWLRNQEHLHGGSYALGAIRAELATTREILQWPLGAGSRIRLLKVAVELSRLAGWSALDAGLPAASERCFVAGLRCAYEAADPVAAANIIKSMSLLYLEAGRPQDARRLLTAGRHAASHGSLRVQAMIATRQARVEADLGNLRGSQSYLGAAADLLESAGAADDHPPETAYFDAAELTAQSAAAYQLLDCHTSAMGLLEATVVSSIDSRPRDRATYQLWLCRSVLATGEVERACTILSTDLSGADVTASVRNQRLLAGIRTQLRRFDLPVVRDVDERLRDLVP